MLKLITGIPFLSHLCGGEVCVKYPKLCGGFLSHLCGGEGFVIYYL